MTTEKQPKYFAILEAFYRSPGINYGEEGFECEKLERDDPKANVFRSYSFIESGMYSMPLGSNRGVAEMIVHALNSAYKFGMIHAEREKRTGETILVGRMGHINRNEESMP